MLRIAPDESGREELASTLDEICRAGATRMLAVALQAEVDAYLDQGKDHRDERGHALVVRNGRARQRTVLTGAGAIEVVAPRVDDRRLDPDTGRRSRFRSSLLPPYARRSPKVAEVLPLLYLHGLSTSDFVPALQEFFGSAAGLSAAAMTRLTASWSAEREAFMNRDLSAVD
jgi:transposase-like protein